MDRTESTVRKMLTAIEAPLYDIDVLSDRVMLPGLDSIPSAALLDRLSLLKHSNVVTDAQIICFPTSDVELLATTL